MKVIMFSIRLPETSAFKLHTQLEILQKQHPSARIVRANLAAALIEIGLAAVENGYKIDIERISWKKIDRIGTSNYTDRSRKRKGECHKCHKIGPITRAAGKDWCRDCLTADEGEDQFDFYARLRSPAGLEICSEEWERQRRNRGYRDKYKQNKLRGLAKTKKKEN